MFWYPYTPTPFHSYTTHPSMDTIYQKYVSYGCVLISIILLVCHDVSFFHYDNVEISDILASVLSWWQISIIFGVILFCIYVYKSIKDMINEIKTMNTTINAMNTTIGDMKEEINTLNTTVKTGFKDTKTGFKDTNTNLGTKIDTKIGGIENSMQKLLGAVLGGVKPDVSDPGEMLRQFKKTFMNNIILVSKTDQDKADIVLTWLKESQFTVEDVSAVDLGIEGNALELLVRGGYMDQALNFDWEKCSLTVLTYFVHEYDNIFNRGDIDLMKSVLYLCGKDLPKRDVAKKVLYTAASSMIYLDYNNNILLDDECNTKTWVGIRQCLEDIHQTVMGKPISNTNVRKEIMEEYTTMSDEKFNSIFERIFV